MGLPPYSLPLLPTTCRQSDHADTDVPRRTQPGSARGDAAGSRCLPHGRGGRSLPGRLQGEPRPAGGVRPQPGRGYADHRAGIRRGRGRGGDGGPATDHRVHDLELRAARDRPAGEFRGQDALHVRRAGRSSDRLPRPVRRRTAARLAALAVVREHVRQYPRLEGRDAGDTGRRKGPAQERDPGRRPDRVHGGRDALQREGRSARRRVHAFRSAWRTSSVPAST